MAILESKAPEPASPTASYNDDDFQRMDPSGVKRGLKTRHLSMMALAGIIGPGILVGTGGALAEGGPASLLISFSVIGMIAFSITQSLGEMTTLYPTGGAFVSLSDRFVDKAFGVAVGWSYWFVWACVLANEYNVISSILVFWGPQVPLWGYFLIFWFAFLGFQMLGVETFGEAEFWLALIKLAGLCAYFIFAIIYASGGLVGQDEALGFRYWNNPGPWVDGFRGVATVFVFASTFYAGVEAVAVAATETRNPSVAVPLAIKQVIWRILFVYIGVAFFFGLTCPSNADGLANGASRALKSPMTIALQNAGWTGGVHLINAFIFITVLSAANSSIYIGSRTILFMAQQKMAPKFLGKTNNRGVPVYAIIFTNLFGAISMMNISTGGGQAYSVSNVPIRTACETHTDFVHHYLVHRQPERSLYFSRMGIYLIHTHTLPESLESARSNPRYATLQVTCISLECLLWPGCQHIPRPCAGLDHVEPLRCRNLC
jgi:amino acid transporter